MQGQHAGRRKRHPFLTVFAVAGGLVVLLVIVLVATASHNDVQKSGTSAPAAATSGTPSSAPQTGSANGRVGTQFTVASSDDHGNPVTYKVALTKVDQHAELSPYNTLSNPEDHMAAVRFTITGVKGNSSDDALSNATGYGKDTTTYDTSLNDVKNGSAFSSGVWQVSPGQTISGWVAFELPPGASLAQVKWTPTAGMSDSAAVWDV